MGTVWARRTISKPRLPANCGTPRRTQPAAPDAGEPTAAAAPSGHAIDPVESRAIISEFFRPGDKDYAPKDFIQAVRAEAREAKDDTVAAMGALGDDDTVIVPDIRPNKATALAAVAWSPDDGDDATVLYDDDEDDDDRTTFWLRLFVTAAAAVVLVLGIVVPAEQSSPTRSGRRGPGFQRTGRHTAVLAGGCRAGPDAQCCARADASTRSGRATSTASRTVQHHSAAGQHDMRLVA